MSIRNLHLRKVTLRMGCGCMKSKPSDTFNPIPKSSATKKLAVKDNAEANGQTHDYSSYNVSPNMKSTPACVGGRFDRMAVEKVSDDPYVDFKDSMLQMILENETYSKDDMSELLNCFLQLNSPCHHGIIIRAFTDILSGVFSVRLAAASRSIKRVRRKARRAVF